MAKENLTERSDEELDTLLDEAKTELLNLRFQAVTGQLVDVKRPGVVRKQVARIKTEMRSREIAAADKAEA